MTENQKVANRTKIALAASAAGLLIVSAVVLWLLGDSPGTGREYYEVRLVECQKTLLERGRVVTRDKVPVPVKASATIVELPENGQTVTKGEVIAVLDEGDLIRRRDDEEEALKEIQLKIDSNQKDYEFRDLEMRLNVKVENAELEHAVLKEKTVKEGLTQEEHRLLEIDVALAELDREDAQNAYDRQERLIHREFASESSLDPYAQKLKSAEVSLENLKLEMSIREQGVPEEQLIELRENVLQKKEVVDRREKERERKLKEIELLQRERKSELKRKKYWIDRLNNEIVATRVESPANGIVQLRMKRDWARGGKWIPWEVGKRIWNNDIFADNIDPGSMQIELMLHESDVPYLKENMPVSITVPAFPDKTLTGRLADLSEMAMDRYDLAPLGQETEPSLQGMFGAVVTIEGAEQDFHPGMSALVEIKADEKKERLVIPRTAVKWEKGKAEVIIRRGMGTELVPVEGSVYNEQYFLVTGGLEPGDVILTEHTR